MLRLTELHFPPSSSGPWLGRALFGTLPVGAAVLEEAVTVPGAADGDSVAGVGEAAAAPSADAALPISNSKIHKVQVYTERKHLPTIRFDKLKNIK